MAFKIYSLTRKIYIASLERGCLLSFGPRAEIMWVSLEGGKHFQLTSTQCQKFNVLFNEEYGCLPVYQVYGQSGQQNDYQCLHNSLDLSGFHWFIQDKWIRKCVQPLALALFQRFSP